MNGCGHWGRTGALGGGVRDHAPKKLSHSHSMASYPLGAGGDAAHSTSGADWED
jgi:hypothetical protein